jgi:hypothetical protein
VLVESGNRSEQTALSRAIRSDDYDEFALVDMKVCVEHGAHDPVSDVQRFDFKHSHFASLPK